MKALYQRVHEASVTVGGQVIGKIGKGVLLLVGIEVDDTEAQIRKMAKKVAGLRVFSDENDKFNDSVLDVGGSILAVSQFTLCGNCSHGRRPEFMQAARPETALPLFDLFVQCLKGEGVVDVQTGEFGAHMDVQLVNNGPVTIWMDTKQWK